MSYILYTPKPNIIVFMNPFYSYTYSSHVIVHHFFLEVQCTYQWYVKTAFATTQ